MKPHDQFPDATWTFTTRVTDRRSFDIDMDALAPAGFLVRFLRGTKCATIQGMFDEFSAALQFPYYVGENWPAFDECIADLDWLSHSQDSLDFGAGIVLAVRDSQNVLKLAYPGALGNLVGCLESAGEYFTTPFHRGEAWDHDPIPFHVVLHGETRTAFRPWQKYVELK
ncbi:MAG: barstar family protein [Acidipropionibacterium acidipropionici]|jgi:hypothetical protein|uniref:barstar family protein n=2 Tax=Acidipropionibacterium acidipropionici TaxID=1748 RepID=UPI002F35A9E1